MILTQTCPVFPDRNQTNRKNNSDQPKSDHKPCVVINFRLSISEAGGAAMTNERKVYPIEIAGVKRDLVLFQIKPGLTIAILNILGDTELVQACAKALNEKLKTVDYDVVVTSESKSIPLAHSLSVENGKPYVIFRKTYKPYMGEALRAETLS